jgi:Mg-chelatase subunit ChlD
MTSQLKEFTSSAARPLPVILLADVSGSMAAEGKIDALNQSVREMLATFASTDDLRAEIHVAIVTFGGEATTSHPASARERGEVERHGRPMAARRWARR